MDNSLSQIEIESLLSDLDNFDKKIKSSNNKNQFKPKEEHVEKYFSLPVINTVTPPIKISDLIKRPKHDFVCGHCGHKMETVMLLLGANKKRKWLLYCPTDDFYVDYKIAIENKKGK